MSSLTRSPYFTNQQKSIDLKGSYSFSTHHFRIILVSISGLLGYLEGEVSRGDKRYLLNIDNEYNRQETSLNLTLL